MKIIILTMTGQNSQVVQIIRPDNILGLWNSNRAKCSLLLHVVESYHVAFFHQQVTSAGKEDLLGVRELNLLGYLVLQVLDQNRMVLVENGESVSCHPNGVQAC